MDSKWNPENESNKGKEAAKRDADSNISDPSSTSFVFVNLTNPEDASDPKTQKFVRQQVQRKYKKATPHYEDAERFPEPEATELPFVNVSHPSQASTAGAKRFIRKQVQLRHHRNKAEAKGQKYSEGSVEPASRSNRELKPKSEHNSLSDSGGFISQFQLSDGVKTMSRPRRDEKTPMSAKIDHSKFIYPIQMTEEAYRLVEYRKFEILHAIFHKDPPEIKLSATVHADEESTNVIPAFREIWFGMILLDPASFLQQLSTTIQHQVFVHGIQDENRGLMYQQQALRSVNERLSDPVLGISDGIVGTVVSFLTYDNIVQDIQSYKVHKTGLARIIRLRGGIETLGDNKPVRLMILWEEVCGACSFDIRPNYPLPTRFLPALPTKSPIPPSQPLLDIICKWNLFYPDRGEYLATLHDFYVLNSMIVDGLPDIWDDPWFLGLRINPMLHRLLPPVITSCEESSGGIIEMVCRLAALIYLGDIRMKFMKYHVTGYHFVERLKNLMILDSTEWEQFQELKLWALVVGGIKSSTVDRTLFVEEIRSLLKEMGIQAWEVATEVVKSFVWIEEIYGQRCQDLGREVMQVWKYNTP